jgi:hypothetical protein
MARTLSSAVQAAIAATPSRVCHLLSFTAGATAYRFAEDRVVFQGNLYLPRLVLESPVTYTNELQLDPVRVRLQNITLETAAMLQAEQSSLQGVEGSLARLFLRANEAVTLFAGKISEVQIEEQTATLTLAGELDPTAAPIPRRKYSALCVWDFKDANCGYADFEDPLDPATALPYVTCPKDFMSCQARGRQHRFPGFIHISRELTQAVEGQAPDAADKDRRLSEAFL